MAALPCSLCEDEPAGMMQTNLDTGDTVQVGASCLIGFMLVTTATIVADVAPDILALYSEQFASIAASNPSPSKQPAKGVAAKSRKGSTAASADDADAADTPPNPRCPECMSSNVNHDGDGIYDCADCSAQFKIDGTLTDKG